MADHGVPQLSRTVRTEALPSFAHDEPSFERSASSGSKFRSIFSTRNEIARIGAAPVVGKGRAAPIVDVLDRTQHPKEAA